MPDLTDIEIQQVSWRTQSSMLSGIRRQVFMEEQGVAESEEWDGLDESARHFLVLDPLGEPIGTARVLLERPKEQGPVVSYHIGRVAVVPSWRRRGLGTTLMQSVIHWCRQDALPLAASIYLNAQAERLDFYRRLGFVAHGELFLDAGIPHRAMFLDPKPNCGELSHA